MSKIIVYIPVKNDKWFVEKAILSALEWADYLFIFDDSSSDGCHEIYKKLIEKHSNLFVMFNRPKFNKTTNESRNFFLNFIRNKIDGYNIIFELHADEVVSALITNPILKNELINLPIGTAIMLPWINIWKHPFLYREDKSVWSGSKGWFGFKDDRFSVFEGPVFHGPRVPEKLLKNKYEIDLPVLHFQFINLGMERSKQALYQIFEKNHFPNENNEHINKKYACAFDERNIILKELEIKHYRKWLELGINIDEQFEEECLNWRDYQVLKNFSLNGVSKYKELNIWYIDWEKKRQLFLDNNINLTFSLNEIIDPRDFSTKMAHYYLNKYQKYPFWRLGFFKLVFNKFIEKLNKL